MFPITSTFVYVESLGRYKMLDNIGYKHLWLIIFSTSWLFGIQMKPKSYIWYNWYVRFVHYYDRANVLLHLISTICYLVYIIKIITGSCIILYIYIYTAYYYQLNLDHHYGQINCFHGVEKLSVKFHNEVISCLRQNPCQSIPALYKDIR